MKGTTNKLSTSYAQLAKLFEFLENANFEEQKDFGENVAGAFTWFLSPPAAIYLEKRFKSQLAEFKNNPRFSWRPAPWHGYADKGIDISLSF